MTPPPRHFEADPIPQIIPAFSKMYDKKNIFFSVDIGVNNNVDALYITPKKRATIYSFVYSLEDLEKKISDIEHYRYSVRDEGTLFKPRHFYFVPMGFLIPKEKIPNHSGLLFFGNDGFQYIRKAPVLWNVPLTADALMEVLTSFSCRR